MRRLRCLAIAALCFATWIGDSSGQELKVLNVRFRQTPDSKVEVTYDLSGDAAKNYRVMLFLIKTNSRRMAPLTNKSVVGDVGEGVRAGRGKRIFWDLPKDFPQGLEGDGYIFVVNVYEQGGRKWPWFLAGLAAAGGGTAVFLLTQSGGPPIEKNLPRPPDFDF